MKRLSRNNQFNLFVTAFYPIVHKGEGKQGCLYPMKAYKYVLGNLEGKEKQHYDEHIKNCKYCTGMIETVEPFSKKQLETLILETDNRKKEQKKFIKELKAKGCVAPKELLDYVYGTLGNRKKEYIQAHINNCEDCEKEIVILQKMKASGELD